ncbi:MAG: hypothetical protein ABIJ09_12890 [Pseudomonadota bacterium]
MTTIQGSGQVGHNCMPKDTTAPPTPGLVRAMAFERAKDDAQFFGNTGGTARPATRDPAYFEFNNVELGTKLQFINLSAKPDASFDTKADVLSLELTGRDVHNRTASVYLNMEQMEKLGLKPGDILQVRAMDQAGNASGHITIELEPDDWANGMVRENIDGNRVDTRGGQLSALDGEAARKNIVAKAVNDTRPPLVLEKGLKLVEDNRFSDEDKKLSQSLGNAWNLIKQHTGKDSFTRDDLKLIIDNTNIPQDARDAATALAKNPELFTRFETAYHRDPAKADGILAVQDIQTINAFLRSVSLVAENAIEPRTSLHVHNMRSNESFTVQVSDDRTINLNLKNVQIGDPIIIVPTDNEGVQGQRIELVFSTADGCTDGKAPKLQGGLSVRLPGVL